MWSSLPLEGVNLGIGAQLKDIGSACCDVHIDVHSKGII